MRNLQADLKPYTFSQFVDFLFAPVAQSESVSRNDRWYFNTKVCFDPHRICGYYVQLFRNSAFLLDHYSRGQLEQGFSAMTVRSLSCSVLELIWNPDLPFVERAECVSPHFSQRIDEPDERCAAGMTARKRQKIAVHLCNVYSADAARVRLRTEN